MKNILLSLAIFACLPHAQASLSPTAPASLRAHMLEVNQQWSTMGNYLQAAPMLNDGRTISFRNEAERIAMHLHLVAEMLREKVGADLSAGASQQRSELLNALDAYASRGVFPRNEILPYRNPVFIDPYNTACAVGQLIIESGHADLAHRIDAEMEPMYIHDMHRSDVDEWAAMHGFTEDELAWIQPGYPPSVPWATLGGGTDGQVDVLLHLASGDLLVAGAFTQAGGTSHVGVARWNGTAYTAMGSIPGDGTATCAIEFNGDLYIGGSWSGGTYDLMKWNGASWLPSAAFSSKYASINDLFVHNGSLYAAGSSSGFAGNSYSVMRMTGNSWGSVGQALNATIHCLGELNGELVCGGEFTGNMFSEDDDDLHVAHLVNDTWTQLGDGLDGTVHSLLTTGEQLYAGGDCVAEIAVRFGLARIAANGTTWEQMMPNIGNYMSSPLDGMTSILDMAERDGHIYLAGDFIIYQGMTSGYGLAVFSGTADDVQPYCAFGGPVRAVEFNGGNTLVIGGNGTTYSNIASVDLATGIAENNARVSFSAWPNPATDRLTITLADGVSNTARVEVIDATGRAVIAPIQLRTSTTTINVAQLSAGSYIARVTDDATTTSRTFIKR